jgi:hypothetical protein
MNGKTILGIVLIAIASAAGFIFINHNKPSPSKPTGQTVATKDNSVNNPVGINKANPGNIRDSLDVFQGEIDSPDSPFKSFSSMSYGFRAMIKIMQTYYNVHGLHTLADMIYRWAPVEDGNDPERYIAFVAGNAPFNSESDMQSILFTGYNEDLKNILTCMTWMEQGAGFIVNENDIRQAFTLI